MRSALAEAKKAYDSGEIPVGAVVVCRNQIIARAHNMTEKLHDVTAHAEMIAITSASNFLNAKYLRDCVLYVTLEPCVMCAGAAFWSQLGYLVYGARDDKRGFTLAGHHLLHPKTKIRHGLLQEESREMLQAFFTGKRGS